MTKKIDIYLLGSGIRSTLQMTLETVQVLQKSRICYILHDDLMVHKQVKKYCSSVIDLFYLYKPGVERSAIYSEIAHLLIDEAKKEPNVSFLAHGHPLFLVSATEYLLDLARTENLRVEIITSVSSFDTILSDLRIDFGYAIQLYDVTTLLINKWALNPNIPSLLFQLSTLLNSKVVFEQPNNNILSPLKDYLLEYFPKNHNCKFIHSATEILEVSNIITVPLQDIDKCSELELWKRPSLYVPPI